MCFFIFAENKILIDYSRETIFIDCKSEESKIKIDLLVKNLSSESLKKLFLLYPNILYDITENEVTINNYVTSKIDELRNTDEYRNKFHFDLSSGVATLKQDNQSFEGYLNREIRILLIRLFDDPAKNVKLYKIFEILKITPLILEIDPEIDGGESIWLSLEFYPKTKTSRFTEYAINKIGLRFLKKWPRFVIYGSENILEDVETKLEKIERELRESGKFEKHKDIKFYLSPLAELISKAKSSQVEYNKYTISIKCIRGAFLDSKESGNISRVQPFPHYSDDSISFPYQLNNTKKPYFTISIDGEHIHILNYLGPFFALAALVLSILRFFI